MLSEVGSFLEREDHLAWDFIWELGRGNSNEKSHVEITEVSVFVSIVNTTPSRRFSFQPHYHRHDKDTQTIT